MFIHVVRLQVILTQTESVAVNPAAPQKRPVNASMQKTTKAPPVTTEQPRILELVSTEMTVTSASPGLGQQESMDSVWPNVVYTISHSFLFLRAYRRVMDNMNPWALIGLMSYHKISHSFLSSMSTSSG